jgi:hypothetical protein
MSLSQTTCKISTDPADYKRLGVYDSNSDSVCFHNSSENGSLCLTMNTLMNLDPLVVACKDGTYNGSKVGRVCISGKTADEVIKECESKGWR